MDKYFIRNEENGMFLSSLVVQRMEKSVSQGHTWTEISGEALFFEREEAEAVITFISDVIDWELAEQLSTVPLSDLIRG